MSAQVKASSIESPWFGVTYREDKTLVTQFIADPVTTGGYTANLGMEETA